MAFGWINASQFSFNSLLLMDTWLLDKISKNNSDNHSKEDIRQSEIFILNELDWAIVYLYPELMEELPYIKLWEKEKLLSITDFRNKIVLDIGSGTGRLAIAAASLAKHVYACEPVDRLREYLRNKLNQLNFRNVYVSDGSIERLPFPENTFDIVISGHVIGDDPEKENAELIRVTKQEGYIIDCPGEDDRKKPNGPSQKLLQLGYNYSHYISLTGGDVYRYWKKNSKK